MRGFRGSESLEQCGMLWKLQGKWHSRLVVSKDSKGEGKGETVIGRRKED